MAYSFDPVEEMNEKLDELLQAHSAKVCAEMNWAATRSDMDRRDAKAKQEKFYELEVTYKKSMKEHLRRKTQER